MVRARFRVIFLVIAMASYCHASTNDQTMFGKSHRDVLKMGLAKWEKTYLRHTNSRAQQFEAVSFYLAATQELTSKVLAKNPEKKRGQLVAYRSALNAFATEMYAAVQWWAEGGSAYSWGISYDHTLIANEELIYRLSTGRNYHENPIGVRLHTGGFQDWSNFIAMDENRKAEAKGVLVKVEDKLKRAEALAATLGTKVKSEFQTYVTTISRYWTSSMHD